MNTFALFNAKAWKKWCWSDRIRSWNMDKSKASWKKIDIANISGKTQYYSSEFKKMRCEIRGCENYQPCRTFIENALAVKITMSYLKTQVAIFKAKFGVNQHDKVLRKQQSFGLRLKKLFPNEDIKQ